MAVQENEKGRAFFSQRQPERVRVNIREGTGETPRKFSTIQSELLKEMVARAKAIAMKVYVEDERDERAQVREAMREVKASRRRAQKTGREIKKLETKTRSIIAKLKAS